MNVVGMKDLSNELAAKLGVPKSQAENIMKNVVDVMSDAICGGGISIKGFLTIKPNLRKGRTGKIAFGENKGQTWTSEDKYVLSVKAGSDLDAKLNG